MTNNLEFFNKEIVESAFSSMFRLLNFKSVTLLKARDIEKDCEILSRSIFFRLFPEFDNEHYKLKVTMDTFINSPEAYTDIVYSIYYGIYSTVLTNLRSFQESLKSENISDDLDLLYEDLSHSDNYFQFLEILKRADEKQSFKNKVSTQSPSSFIKEINKRKFDFFR